MRRRLLGLCLLAYPRVVRNRDGDQLRDLALDLAATHGTAREALGLLRGGVAERRRLLGRTGRAAIAVTAATAAALGVLTWAASADGQVEEDRFSCAGTCAAVQAEVAARVRDGWTCAEGLDSVSVTWRCTRD